jgi:hypothetical protein
MEMSAEILIRSLETRGYWGTDRRWWGNSKQAQLFSSAQSADDFCRDNGLTNVEIVVLRPNRPPLCIPVRAAR